MMTPKICDEDLAEIIDAGEASLEEIGEATRRAYSLTDRDLLGIDPFQGDVEETAILRNRMVKGRKRYADHWSGWPIQPGDLHRCIVERTEDGRLTTTRHSLLSLWVMHQGYDPSALREEERTAA